MVSVAYISPSATMRGGEGNEVRAMHGGLANLQQRPIDSDGGLECTKQVMGQENISEREDSLSRGMDKHGWKPHWLDGNTCITYNGMSKHRSISQQSYTGW